MVLLPLLLVLLASVFTLILWSGVGSVGAGGRVVIAAGEWGTVVRSTHLDPQLPPAVLIPLNVELGQEKLAIKLIRALSGLLCFSSPGGTCGHYSTNT